MNTYSTRSRCCWASTALAFASLCLASPLVAAEATVSVELVTERGVQITAPREWLQLLAGMGLTNVTVREARSGDKPSVESVGTEKRPRYRVVGVLTRRDELQLPGGRYTRTGTKQLKDYFQRLKTVGPAADAAETGRFGLTEKQFDTVFKELSKPLLAKTEKASPVKFITQVDKALALKVKLDPKAADILKKAPAIDRELDQHSTGTSLAMVLRQHGLVFLPEKQRGNDVALRVARAGDVKTETWPIGWKSDKSPSRLAPKFFESLNAEVDGFTLTEAIDAISPRVDVPFYWDQKTLAENKIDPTKVQAKFPRRKTHLKRVVDSLLFQARLKGELKVDEAGKPFYWITR